MVSVCVFFYYAFNKYGVHVTVVVLLVMAQCVYGVMVVCVMGYGYGALCCVACVAGAVLLCMNVIFFVDINSLFIFNFYLVSMSWFSLYRCHVLFSTFWSVSL